LALELGMNSPQYFYEMKNALLELLPNLYICMYISSARLLRYIFQASVQIRKKQTDIHTYVVWYTQTTVIWFTYVVYIRS
jgi:hypothetical protein